MGGRYTFKKCQFSCENNPFRHNGTGTCSAIIASKALLRKNANLNFNKLEEFLSYYNSGSSTVGFFDNTEKRIEFLFDGLR